ncbi:type VII secretion-associated serine protease mycosin [Mycobacterium sp.]|uniref:type VII secretion-associated serine protease mycosin n=1 Tax=Mycobacterium sp. TaxID=1785 RepID=UPI0025F82606|nr:type VII secretion-associated serine protease mycosin [Mycobacterium sp.]
MAAATLAAWPQCVTSPAQAVSPPPVDERYLPQPAPASPPRPTVQREICAVPSLQRDTAADQLAALDLHRVWRLTRGAGQLVAIIDTGVAPNPRLPRVLPGGDYVSTGNGTQDCDGHGTAVAGIIAGAAESNHADDFSGVAPGANLISIRQSSTRFGPAADPAVAGYGDVTTMARAVRTAADLNASVINISSVACTPAGSALDDRALGAALSYAVDTKNAVVVAAAGNAGAGQCPPQRRGATWETATVVASPGWYDDYVLTVGSVNAAGQPSSFTLAGPWVDVAAPGEGLTSLSTSGGLANVLGNEHDSTPLSGTSYAAPVVSGLAALIRSRFPTWTARQVMQRIKATAHRPPGGPDPRVGVGVVDLLSAVSTDAPAAPSPTTNRAPAPLDEPPATPTRNPRVRQMALCGVTMCGGSLAALLLLRATWTRLRRSGSRRRNILSD